MYRRTDIGAYIKPVVGTAPQAGSAAINGSGIERTKFYSCVLHVTTGAATGAPTTISVIAKLQHSADNGVGDPWSDYDFDNGAGTTTAAATTAITATNSAVRINVPLMSAKAYIRVVLVPTLSGGASPTIQTQSTIVLGGAESIPIT